MHAGRRAAGSPTLGTRRRSARGKPMQMSTHTGLTEFAKAIKGPRIPWLTGSPAALPWQKLPKSSVSDRVSSWLGPKSAHELRIMISLAALRAFTHLLAPSPSSAPSVRWDKATMNAKGAAQT